MAAVGIAHLSVLDLAFVSEGATPADALRNSLDLAQHAEQLGYALPQGICIHFCGGLDCVIAI